MVRAHQLRGHTLAVISAATRYQIDPIARDLRIEHVLCSALEVEGGRFTGSVRRTVYGKGKLDAARGFAESRGIDLSDSYFYSDGGEDLPLLEAVGRPRPINPDAYLASVARGRGWPVREFTSRSSARPSDALRTLALVASAPGPALLAAAPRIAGRTGPVARAARCAALGSGRRSAAAGLRVRARGAENLLQPRPAIFVFNHQSAIDPLLLSRVMRVPFAWLVAAARPARARCSAAWPRPSTPSTSTRPMRAAACKPRSVGSRRAVAGRGARSRRAEVAARGSRCARRSAWPPWRAHR